MDGRATEHEAQAALRTLLGDRYVAHRFGDELRAIERALQAQEGPRGERRRSSDQER